MSTAVLILAAAAPASASGKASIEGRWSNPKDSVIVNVARCGPAYCGRVSWASPKAKAKAGGRLVGRELMSGFRPDGSGAYKGKVFEPRHGIHASATIRAVGANTLLVKGCAISGVLCKEQRWSRVH